MLLILRYVLLYSEMRQGLRLYVCSNPEHSGNSKNITIQAVELVAYVSFTDSRDPLLTQAAMFTFIIMPSTGFEVTCIFCMFVSLKDLQARLQSFSRENLPCTFPPPPCIGHVCPSRAVRWFR